MPFDVISLMPYIVVAGKFESISLLSISLILSSFLRVARICPMGPELDGIRPRLFPQYDPFYHQYGQYFRQYSLYSLLENMEQYGVPKSYYTYVDDPVLGSSCYDSNDVSPGMTFR